MSALIISEVEIGQMALSHIGDNTNVENFDQKGAAPSQLKIWYNPARIAALEAYDWTFARKRIQMATHGQPADGQEYCFRYDYPNDMLTPRYIVNPAGKGKPPVPYAIEDAGDGTRSVVTNLDQAKMVYTSNVTDPSMWPMHFIQALSYQLAFLIAWPLTKKVNVQDRMDKAWDRALIRSKARDINQEMREPEPDADWTQDR